MTLIPHTRLGYYEILKAIGAGGMGEVYRALDTRLDREVAIKLPDAVDSRALRDLLLKKYGIVIKVEGKRLFNGNRLSPHIFNTEKEIDAAIQAIRTELA
jgi:serine/threonine protein kinase